ncbi:MAG TPA: hypothetical protein VFH44_01865 [Solirubrobacterales bacterium]|nr:hypothetical protein [Solirubrobacterales bacterium]
MADPAGRGIPRAARATILLGVLATLLIAAPAAEAAFGIAGFSAQPASKAAGANSNLSVSFDVTEPAAGLKDVTVHLPPGLIGNPLATPTCTEPKLMADDCPARSDVGDATNEVTVKPLGLLPIPLTVNGQVYNVEPRKGEPARFGIVLDPSPVPGLGLLPKIVLQQTARLRQSDFGLDTSLRDIPRSARIGGVSTPLEVRGVALTLRGKVNGGKGFLRNPTSCKAQTIAIDAAAYNGATASAQDQFTTTNCGALPFSPRFSAEIRQLSPDLAEPVELTTSISQTIEEAGLKRAIVSLPTDIIGNGPALAIQCPAATFASGGCADDTIVGDAVADSPLQAKPLSGKVYLVTPTGPSPFPDLGVDLKGGLALQVKGAISAVPVPGGLQVVVTFDGLPDIPLSDFRLTFAGGEGGLNVAARSPCEPPPFVFNADFLGHSGATRNVDVDADASCGGGKGKPKARVEVAKLGSGKPRLRIRLRGRGAEIRRAEVKLPRGLKAGPKRKLARRGHVSGGGSLRGHARLLHVRAGGEGSKSVRVRLGRGAIKARSHLRARKLGRFRIKVRTAAGETARLSVRAR